MRGYAHSDEDREAAVAIVAEQGLAAAWRQTGIPKPTIVKWCKDAGVERFHPERTRAAVDALQQSASLLREQLRVELLERAVDLLERMDEPHIEFKGKDGGEVTYPIAPASAVQNYATSAAILIDKYRLEVGEATGRVETLSVTDGLSADTKRELRARLAGAVRGESSADGAGGDSERAGAGVDTGVTPDPA